MTNNILPIRLKHISGLLLVIGLLAVYGCSHYKLGQPGELPFTTLYVPPIENRSFAPQIQASLTQQLIAKLQEQRNVKIVDSPAADATLLVTVIDYQRNVAATQQSDTYLAESFSLTLIANVKLENNRSGEDYITDREVSATQQAFVTGGFQPSEYEAMPVLTDKMALKITNMVTSVW